MLSQNECLLYKHLRYHANPGGQGLCRNWLILALNWTVELLRQQALWDVVGCTIQVLT